MKTDLTPTMLNAIRYYTRPAGSRSGHGIPTPGNKTMAALKARGLAFVGKGWEVTPAAVAAVARDDAAKASKEAARKLQSLDVFPVQATTPNPARVFAPIRRVPIPAPAAAPTDPDWDFTGAALPAGYVPPPRSSQGRFPGSVDAGTWGEPNHEDD